MRGDRPGDFSERAKAFVQATNQKAETVATRKASQLAITALVDLLPEMLGGSDDLTGSTPTDWKGVEPVRVGVLHLLFGRHINFGVRQFGMAAIMNGAALPGGSLPVGGKIGEAHA